MRIIFIYLLDNMFWLFLLLIWSFGFISGYVVSWSDMKRSLRRYNKRKLGD